MKEQFFIGTVGVDLVPCLFDVSHIRVAIRSLKNMCILDYRTDENQLYETLAQVLDSPHMHLAKSTFTEQMDRYNEFINNIRYDGEPYPIPVSL